MDKKSKLFLAFGAGALLGAALVALFTTETGKEMMEKAKGEMDDLSEEVKKKVKALQEEIADLLNAHESGENKQA